MFIRRSYPWRIGASISVMLWLVRAVRWHSEVVSLFFGQRRELDTDFFQVQTSDLFIELLGQPINGRLIEILVRPKVELGKDLVGKGIGHDEAGMAGSTTKVHQPAFGEQV